MLMTRPSDGKYTYRIVKICHLDAEIFTTVLSEGALLTL